MSAKPREMAPRASEGGGGVGVLGEPERDRVRHLGTAPHESGEYDVAGGRLGPLAPVAVGEQCTRLVAARREHARPLETVVAVNRERDLEGVAVVVDELPVLRSAASLLRARGGGSRPSHRRGRRGRSIRRS